MLEEKKSTGLSPTESDHNIRVLEHQHSVQTTPCTDDCQNAVPVTNTGGADECDTINEVTPPSQQVDNDFTNQISSVNLLSVPSSTIEHSIPTVLVTIANDDFDHIVTTCTQSSEYSVSGCTQHGAHTVVNTNEPTSQTVSHELTVSFEEPQVNVYDDDDDGYQIKHVSSESYLQEDSASSKLGSSGTSKTKSGGNLRRGKWTAEEEAYVARVIQDFNSGYLDTPAGTTLRTYLSEKLKCDPMRYVQC